MNNVSRIIACRHSYGYGYGYGSGYGSSIRLISTRYQTDRTERTGANISSRRGSTSHRRINRSVSVSDSGRGTNRGNHDKDENDQQQQQQRESTLFPRPHPHPNEHHSLRPVVWPRTFKQWKIVFSQTWRNYSSTWEGFTLGGYTVVVQEQKEPLPTPPTQDEKITKFRETLVTKRNQVRANVQQNLNLVKEDGTELVERVKNETGIHTAEDLKVWAGDQLKLATECLKEFMTGYRKGRDDEVDAMMNEYFTDVLKNDDSDNGDDGSPTKRTRRRKPKRRSVKR